VGSAGLATAESAPWMAAGRVVGYLQLAYTTVKWLDHGATIGDLATAYAGTQTPHMNSTVEIAFNVMLLPIDAETPGGVYARPELQAWGY